MTDMVEKLVRVGVLTPEEGRMLASDIFNREFAKVGADWTMRPNTLTLAGIQTGVEDLRPKAPTETLVDQAKPLVALREELAAEEERIAGRRMALARESLAAPESERVSVPATEWRRWFDDQGADGD